MLGASPVELTPVGPGMAGDDMTSIVDSSDLPVKGPGFERTVVDWEVFSGCTMLFWLVDFSAIAAGWFIGSVNGCDCRVLAFGINAEAKADFSFDLSKIPDAIPGRCIGDNMFEMDWGGGNFSMDVMEVLGWFARMAASLVMLPALAPCTRANISWVEAERSGNRGPREPGRAFGFEVVRSIGVISDEYGSFKVPGLSPSPEVILLGRWWNRWTESRALGILDACFVLFSPLLFRGLNCCSSDSDQMAHRLPQHALSMISPVDLQGFACWSRGQEVD